MRYWRVAISVVSILFVLLFLFAWMTSYVTFVRVSLPLDGHTLVCISYRGQLSAVLVPIHIPEIWWELGDVQVSGNTYPDQLWPRKRVLGFGWITETTYLNVPNAPVPRALQQTGLSGRSFTCNATGLILPDWFVAIMHAPLAFLPWVKPRFSVLTMLAVITLIATMLGIFIRANRAPLEKLSLG